MRINLEDFGEKWNNRYPQIYKSWSQNWTNLATFFKYPDEVRKLIYTANPVKGFHRTLRKYTKSKTTYPNDEAVKKNLYISQPKKSPKSGVYRSEIGE